MNFPAQRAKLIKPDASHVHMQGSKEHVQKGMNGKVKHK